MDSKIKKIIPYFFLLLLISVGLFAGAERARADTTATCTLGLTPTPNQTLAQCQALATSTKTSGVWNGPAPTYNIAVAPAGVTTGACIDNGTGVVTSSAQPCPAGSSWSPTATAGAGATAAAPAAPQTAFQDALANNTCGFGVMFAGGSKSSVWPGCALQVSYGLFYQFPAWLLAQVAYFFNVLISVTLYSSLLQSPFVSQAWAVVRDLSNLFFILILLYIAIELILGLGHDAKKMIVRVIIIALLINFSMFFTEVIIDSSNILALIFYNKISVDTKNPDGSTGPRPYASVTGEKDVSGGMVSAFDPTSKLGSDFFAQTAKVYDVNGTEQPSAENGSNAAPSILFGIIILSGAIMLFACYSLFIAGLSFLGRLIELWILIIFSPFALMSSTIPILSSVEYLGWSAWFKRLLKVSFMASIFMFFLYFIFMLIHADIFGGLLQITPGASGPATVIKTILSIVLPTCFILILLLKATEFAKKGSGAIGEAIFKGAAVVGGLALGAATGGAAVLGRATVGRAGAAMSNSEWAKRREREGRIGSSLFRNTTKAIGSGSFDVRGVKIAGKDLAGATGMSLGKAQEGGFEKRKKEQVEKRKNRAKELQVGENDPLKQALNKTENDLQGLLGANANEIETVDKLVEKKRQEVSDANSKLNAAKGTPAEAAAQTALRNANAELDDAKLKKTHLINGQDHFNLYGPTAGITDRYSRTAVTASGDTIDKLEKQKRVDTQAIKTKNAQSNQSYANAERSTMGRVKGFIFSGGAYTGAAAEEAAHEIIMETKLDSGTKT